MFRIVGLCLHQAALLAGYVLMRSQAEIPQGDNTAERERRSTIKEAIQHENAAGFNCSE
jgi:hypothetical protein